jgi:hypothetical protein
MELSDGTYLKLGRRYHRLEIDHGYWVATTETKEEYLGNLSVFGVWEDDTGKVWLDLVTYVGELEPAIALGKRYKQLAIWDNYNQKEITL